MQNYDNRMAETLSRSFEIDENGQMYYAPAGSITKIPVENSEYDDVLFRLETRVSVTKIIFFVIFFLGVSLTLFLSIRRGFEISYLLFIFVPIVLFFAASGFAAYSSIRPLEQKRIEAAGGLKASTKRVARTLGFVLWTVVTYFVVRAIL